MKKTVFVTGGSGFVGKNLIPQLISEGYIVKALARSKKSEGLVKSLGAVPVKGSLANLNALKAGMQNTHAVFHLAASVDFFAPYKELEKMHVKATNDLLDIAKSQGVKNFIYLGAASVIMNGKPIKNADETFVSDTITDGYSMTKLKAEKAVLKANSPKLRTIALRPPLIWGKGDPNTLPAIVKAIKKGQMMLINKGEHKFVTCHIKNVCHALILAEQTSKGGETYFITDLETPVFKEFMSNYVSTQNVSLPQKSVSLKQALIIARIMKVFWNLLPLKGHPPLYKGLVNVLGLEFTVDCSKAVKQLNYKPVISIRQGMNEM